MKANRPIFFWASGLIAFLLIVFFALLFFIYLLRAPLTHEEAILRVAEGDSLYSISANFKDGKMPHFARKLYVRLFHHGAPLYQGEYTLKKEMAWPDLVRNLTAGIGKRYYAVMLAPGMTNDALYAHLTQTDFLVGEISQKTYKEGAFLPQTYHVERGETRMGLLARMHQARQERFQKLWEKRSENLPFKKMEEAIILASIVEKEARFEDERALIASVYINRLKKGMRLQADPTLVYILTKMRGRKPKKIYYKDLKLRTPYNSYLYRGLPPTAIANPGVASFEAVLHPAKTDYLYFVLDPKTGRHLFAKHFKQHRKNRRAL